MGVNKADRITLMAGWVCVVIYQVLGGMIHTVCGCGVAFGVCFRSRNGGGSLSGDVSE
jgi:hypothetical protein